MTFSVTGFQSVVPWCVVRQWGDRASVGRVQGNPNQILLLFYSLIIAFPSLSGTPTLFMYRKCFYHMLWRDKNLFILQCVMTEIRSHPHSVKKNVSMTVPPPACDRWWHLRCTSPALSLTDRSWPALWAGPKIALASITRSVKSTVTEPA